MRIAEEQAIIAGALQEPHKVWTQNFLQKEGEEVYK
jgi:hypothetical protein